METCSGMGRIEGPHLNSVVACGFGRWGLKILHFIVLPDVWCVFQLDSVVSFIFKLKMPLQLIQVHLLNFMQIKVEIWVELCNEIFALSLFEAQLSDKFKVFKVLSDSLFWNDFWSIIMLFITVLCIFAEIRSDCGNRLVQNVMKGSLSLSVVQRLVGWSDLANLFWIKSIAQNVGFGSLVKGRYSAEPYFAFVFLIPSNLFELVV